MKKTLSIVLSLVLLVGMIPAFADGNTATDTLSSWGIIKGDGNSLMEGETLKRQNAAIILCRMMGVEEEAKAADPTQLPFEDLQDKMGRQTTAIIAYTYMQEWFRGMSETEFGWGQEITAQQFAMVLLRALGYDSPTAYATALEDAQAMGLFDGVQSLQKDDPIVRSDIYVAMLNTLNKPKKDGDKPLKEILGYVQPAPAEFAVKSIENAGLKVIRVEFNKEVETLGTVEVKNSANSPVGFMTPVKLSEDKKVALVVLNSPAAQYTTLKVKVKDFKDASGAKAAEIEQEVTLFDATKPEVTGVEVVNPKTFKVMTTEPLNYGNDTAQAENISYWNNIKIDDHSFYGKIEKSYCNGFVLRALTGLSAGEHTLKITGIKDYANFPMEDFEATITVVADNDAPVLEEITAVDTKTLKLVFNEELSQKGRYRLNGSTTDILTGNVTRDGKVVTIDLSSDPLTVAAIVGVEVKYKGQKDIMGNTISDWQTMNFQVPNDTELPTVEITSVKKDASNNAMDIELKFSKSMDKTSATWKVLDKDNNPVSGASGDHTGITGWNSDNTTAKIAVTQLYNMDASNYSLVLENMKDGTVRANELAKTTMAFDVADTKAPAVEGVNGASNEYYVDAANKTAVIKFSEAMDEALLMNKNNIRLKTANHQSKQLLADIADATVQYMSDSHELRITVANLSDLQDAASGGNYIDIQLWGMKDIAGNTLAIEDIQRVVPEAPILDTSSTTNLKKKDGQYYLEFNFSQPVQVADANGIKYSSATPVVLQQIWVEEQKPFTKKLTFAIPNTVTIDQDDATLGFEYSLVFEANAIVNQYAEKNAQIDVTYASGSPNTIEIEDKVAPMIVQNPKFETGNQEIRVKLSEDIDISSSAVTGQPGVITCTVVRDNQVLALDGTTAFEFEATTNTLSVHLDSALANQDKQVSISLSVRDENGNVMPYTTKNVDWAN